MCAHMQYMYTHVFLHIYTGVYESVSLDDGGADRSAAGGQAAGPPNPQTISSNL